LIATKTIPDKARTRCTFLSSRFKRTFTNPLGEFQLFNERIFIYIENLKDNKVRLINPNGKLDIFDSDLFDKPKEESIDYLFSYELISDIQLEKYNEWKTPPEPNGDYQTPPPPPPEGRVKDKSPSAYEWSREVPELARISFSNWKQICDHLKIKVEGDSARRKLERWVEKNKPNWPPVPRALSR
jgi:hypothetical protein